MCVCECAAASDSDIQVFCTPWNRLFTRSHPYTSISIINTILLDKPSKTRRWVACVIFFSSSLLCFGAPTPHHLTIGQKIRRAHSGGSVIGIQSLRAPTQIHQFLLPIVPNQTNDRHHRRWGKKSGLSLAASPSIFRTLFAQSMCHFCRPVNIEMRGTDMRTNQSRSVVFRWLIHHNGESCSQRLNRSIVKLNRFTGCGSEVRVCVQSVDQSPRGHSNYDFKILDPLDNGTTFI